MANHLAKIGPRNDESPERAVSEVLVYHGSLDFFRWYPGVPFTALFRLFFLPTFRRLGVSLFST
jgi:hypothetical protein